MKKTVTKIVSLLAALTFVVGMLAACSGGNSTTTTTTSGTTAATEATTTTEAATTTEAGLSGEIVVFAAASMTETLTKIGDNFMAENPNTKVTFNFDSSGTLKTQIQEGADCDIFISAGQKQMNQLDIEASSEVNTEGLDFVETSTRFNLVENKCVLAVPEGNPKEIKNFDDLAARLAEGTVFMAMGNSDVPVGQYTQKILEYYNLDEEELAAKGVITYGSNVKEVTTQVSEATVDCGVVYATDAYSAGLSWVAEATKEQTGGQVIYPAARLKVSKNPEVADAFLEFITNAESCAILKEVGFTPLQEKYTGEIIVFAAASMTETLTKIGENFKSLNPDLTITFNFDSSGTLKTQIQEGADCDIFISAGQKQMNQLDIEASSEVNTEGLDFVVEPTRFNLVENKCVLAVPDGNPKDLKSFDDLAARLAEGTVFMAMGNSDVPVGQYTQKILEYYNLNEEDLASKGVITYGSNVKEVTTQVSEATVDCGVVYATDAYSAGLNWVDEATKEMTGGQVIYPAAVLNISNNPDAAKAFLEYLKGAEASAILKEVGFTPLS